MRILTKLIIINCTMIIEAFVSNSFAMRTAQILFILINIILILHNRLLMPYITSLFNILFFALIFA